MEGRGKAYTTILFNENIQQTDTCPRIMSSAVYIRHKVVLMVFLLLALTMFIFMSMTTSTLGGVRYNPNMKIPLVYKPQYQVYSAWPEYVQKSRFDEAYFKSNCVTSGDYSISGLSNILKQWSFSTDLLCKEMYEKFRSVYLVDERSAPMRIPPELAAKVKGWLGNNDELVREVYNQTVIHVSNVYTREQNIFNPLRDKRPVPPVKEPENVYFDKLVNESAQSCDFCNFKALTAEHVFGRVESKHSFSASNVFKLDTLHALVALKQHNPLRWSEEQFLDMMELTKTWIAKANHYYPKAVYPVVIMDVLPKCGASQVHPHSHVMLDPRKYHGEVEKWRVAAENYFIDFSSNYFSDLVAFYSGLDLTVTLGTATAFASLTPKKDNEVVVVAKEANSDFYRLLYFVLRAFVEDLHKYCYSMGIGLPSVGDKKGQIPAFARVITRGPVTEVRTDVSSLELFAATNMNISPYKTIQAIRNSVKMRSS